MSQVHDVDGAVESVKRMLTDESERLTDDDEIRSKLTSLMEEYDIPAQAAVESVVNQIQIDGPKRPTLDGIPLDWDDGELDYEEADYLYREGEIESQEEYMRAMGADWLLSDEDGRIHLVAADDVDDVYLEAYGKSENADEGRVQIEGEGDAGLFWWEVDVSDYDTLTLQTCNPDRDGGGN